MGLDKKEALPKRDEGKILKWVKEGEFVLCLLDTDRSE